MQKQDSASLHRKIFKHNFVPEIELGTEYIGGKRHYVLPNGRKYKSVTTILDERTDKTALYEWRKRVGEEEANRISTQAARRGTSIHSIAERYVLNEEDYFRNEMPVNVETFKSIQAILNQHIDSIFGIELPLYSILLQTAGRCDMIAKFDDQLTIVDFKTSRKLKKEEWIENYFIQATCYSLMFEEIYKIKVPQLAIIIAVDNEDPQVFVRNTKDFYNRTKQIFVDMA